MSSYTVTLTAEELAHLVTAYRFMRHESEVPSALAALEGAKPIRAKKAAAPVVAEPLVSQGDPALDAFIAAHHRANWRAHLISAFKNRAGMMRVPAPPKGHDPIALKPHERAALYEAHQVRESRV